MPLVVMATILIIASKVERGFVYGFDIQQEAIDNTRLKIDGFENVKLILDGHENIKNIFQKNILVKLMRQYLI